MVRFTGSFRAYIKTHLWDSNNGAVLRSQWSEDVKVPLSTLFVVIIHPITSNIDYTTAPPFRLYYIALVNNHILTLSCTTIRSATLPEVWLVCFFAQNMTHSIKNSHHACSIKYIYILNIQGYTFDAEVNGQTFTVTGSFAICVVCWYISFMYD